MKQLLNSELREVVGGTKLEEFANELSQYYSNLPKIREVKVPAILESFIKYIQDYPATSNYTTGQLGYDFLIEVDPQKLLEDAAKYALKHK